MRGFLLGTNVISEMTRAKPEARVSEWLDSIDEAMLYLSVLTLGEVRKGLSMLGSSPRRAHLEAWLLTDLPTRFAGRLLDIDSAIADRWGQLAGHAHHQGEPLPVIDGLLAATALHHDLTIATRNARDFSHHGIQSFDPWAHA